MSDLLKIESKKLESGHIKHGFFGRNGGVSFGVFSSLNCSKFVGDDEKNVVANLNIAKRALNASKLITLKQAHGNLCIQVDSKTESNIEADAIVTATSDIAIGILTADCAPILFFDRKNKIIGAAHAGWRGALSNIVDSTVGQMIKHGGERENIIAAIGPCILKHSYEVSKDFRQNFDEESDCFCKVHSKLYFDLPRYCKRKLLMAGLSEENIDILEIDTYANFDKYFSHRYAIKNTNGVGGRNISVICL